MESICFRDDKTCEVHAVVAALHSLHLYFVAISATLLCCCISTRHNRCGSRWRGQNIRGVASLVLLVTWCCSAAAAALRPRQPLKLVAEFMSLPAWFAAAYLHVALWTRSCAAPVLYLAIYWLLTAISSASILWQYLVTKATLDHIEIYFQAFSIFLELLMSVVDCVCFYDEVSKRFKDRTAPSSQRGDNVKYQHHSTHFYSKICFNWINSFMYKGYQSPLDDEQLGDLPENECSKIFYNKFKRIYNDSKNTKHEMKPSMLRCYMKMVFPNFYIAGILKLFNDLLCVVPALGLAVIIQYVEDSNKKEVEQIENVNSYVTCKEFFNNGFVMLLLITLALISQAFLSQNSTHLVTTEGTRLKSALQGMVFDKCMRLAPWSNSDIQPEEESPLLHVYNDKNTSQTGLLTNLVSQDTYNVMSCVCICHYTWAIPVKITVILYLLYTKLGISALIGSAVSIVLVMPLQFYIGKKLSDNSKEISKCTDHRISKMAEIMQGMTVIKLYVWEDLFKEKILNLRELELKHLNKDSMYWSFLTFTTQFLTLLVTTVTFVTFYFLNDSKNLTAVNIFAGLALFNQLSIPLLILPVTVLMVIQAVVSTKRIHDFLKLPESENVNYNDMNEDCEKLSSDKCNEGFIDTTPGDNTFGEHDATDEDDEDGEKFSDTEMLSLAREREEFVVRFRNAGFSWGSKNYSVDIDDLDIPTGKLIMVVGSSGSGKSSFLSAVLGELYRERGEVIWNGSYSTWYAGQPPWLVQGSVRDNVVMNGSWCQKRYARVLRATGLRPDLQLLPEGDATNLGSHGAPLSGGQRVRVCLARALYSCAKLVVLDEPLAALDATLARHVVARGLVPSARSGRTLLVATNRLELLHYADLVIAMDDGRISGFGKPTASSLARWAQMAAEARAVAARGGAGPPGGSDRERSQLVRALSKARFRRHLTNDEMVGISEATGAHLFAEVPSYAGSSWRCKGPRARPKLSRQLSSPPPSMHDLKWRRDVQRSVSADASNTTLQREASVLRRLLRPRTHRTLARWTPRTLRRLLSSDSDTPNEENEKNVDKNTDESMLETTYSSLTSNGIETTAVPVSRTSSRGEPEITADERRVWCEHARGCGWWGAAYWAAAAAAQALAVTADCWLSNTAANKARYSTDGQMWVEVRTYGMWGAGACAVAAAAQAFGAGAGGRARRALHERLLRAALRAPPLAYHPHYNYRFSADMLLIDRKLPIAMTRWVQLLLLCATAFMVNIIAAPATVLALLPALFFFYFLQTIYLRNARELQRLESVSASRVVSRATEACAGGRCVRVGGLQARMAADFLRRLDRDRAARLMLDAAARWLGLTLDLVGAATVLVSLGVALYDGKGTAAAGLAGTYSLLLPAYLAHLAKCRADLDLHLAAVERVQADTKLPQEDYREDCPLPSGWLRNGKIEFENVSVQQEPGSPLILNNINMTIAPGEKVVICGRSGSGKSTLLLSCAGATTITQGRILIDGHDVRVVPLRALRHRVVVLPQEPILFSGTLRENLDPLGVHTDEEIWQCLRAVGLCDFVTAQSAGLECLVRCRGVWTASRAARVGAARATLHARSAAALLLDEPAATLDAAADRALRATLVNAAPNTTIITVAHRVSSFRGYDRVIVIDEGRIVEQGEPSELLSQPHSRLTRLVASVHR